MALRLLAPIAENAYAPSMLYPRRQGVAVYARALLAAGRPQEALAAAELAETIPSVDIRSQVRSALALAECLAAAGRIEEAGKANKRASMLAHSTQQVSERGSLLTSLP
jgi:hypothetical protein